MAAARGLNGDPAQARRDSPDPGRRHDGRGHLAAIFRAARAARLLNEPRASDSIDLLTFTGLQLHAPRQCIQGFSVQSRNLHVLRNKCKVRYS